MEVPQAKLCLAIRDMRQALVRMHEELENCRLPGTSRGLARMDDEMSAALVSMVVEAATMQGGVLACLNEQPVRTEEGEEVSTEWALAAAAAAAALVESRPALD
jgi:hypothetical protein